MLVIEKFDEGIGWISVGFLWECGGRSRGSNDYKEWESASVAPQIEERQMKATLLLSVT